ncbi:hypothetical protein F5984_09770 [Rudanella paleaurantiibacter]|uniref:Uncharacterized protein n=2 Tax=Rudanella paleaurantiibacter TaxID=2614655 RepID=A0A7J5U017_9BACT|nr:hypothetical protein F5984_09770 [Rudanella paleaurantiibacter]
MFSAAHRMRWVAQYLAGHAAEQVLTGEVYDFWGHDIDEPHDFGIAWKIIESIADGSVDGVFVGSALEDAYQETIEFLKTPVVWQAIELVANEVFKRKEITRDNGLFELAEKVFALPVFADVQLITPHLTIPARNPQ